MEEIKKSAVGAKLKLLRENCGYTQQQIATILNIDRSTYAYYETGKTFPDINTFLTLSRIFNVNLFVILDREAEVTVAAPDLTKELTGSGKTITDPQIYDLNKQEKQLVGSYRAATPEQRRQIFEMMRRILRDSDGTV